MENIDIHADDYGLTMNASKDILEGINAGKLNSTSILPNMSCYDEALRWWKQELKRGMTPKVSVHLNFMEGHCCAPKQDVCLLVDEKGYFKLSWVDLVTYNYNCFKYQEVKRQLKTEIREQLWKVIQDYKLLEGKKLRVDSHQHTHMIPIVMEALLEVIREDRIPTEYIRVSKEAVLPYIKNFGLYPTYRIVNLVKVAILNFFSMKDEKMLKKHRLPSMILCGVLFSGRMDLKRVKKILPELKKTAERKQVILEVVLHPGRALQKELGEEFVSEEAKAFYLSCDRKIEHQTMMRI